MYTVKTVRKWVRRYAEALVFPPVVLDDLLVQYKAELAQWAA